MGRRRLVVSLFIAISACDKPGAARDAAKVETGADSAQVAVSGEWPSELGSALIVPSDTESFALVLYPTTATPVDAQTRFSLLGPGGETIRARAGVAGPDSSHCGDAPMVHLVQTTPPVWSIGISNAGARAMRADSLDAMPEADSVRYLAAMARLASVVVAPVSSRLTGLSFALAGLRRVQFGDTTVIVAQLVRRVNQEANPIEERTLIVAEQIGKAEFVTVHSSRSEGTDETAAHHDLAGAFRSTGAIYLLLTTDSPAGSMIEVLERSGGAWRVRWTRSIAC